VTADVLVLGGGPAGAVLARRLHAAGAVVTLATAAAGAGVEGLSQRSVALLEEEGLADVVAALDGPVPRGGRWGNGRAVEGAEWLVDRELLAARARAAARTAGVAVHGQVAVRTERGAGGWRVTLRDGTQCRARLVVDARGRRGRATRGPALLALGQRLSRPPGAPEGTVVWPFAEGWCWIATGADSRWVQLVGRPRGRRPAEWFAAAAARVPALRAALLDGAPLGPATARAAHARLRGVGEDDAPFAVGDAALALDPLSGQGVYEALRGARAVAAAVRTVLDGGEPGLARRFVAERATHAFGRAVATAAGLYAENGAIGAFWRETAAAYAGLAARGADPRPPRVERRPVLDSGTIREQDVLVTAEDPRGVWHVRGVPVVALLDYFRCVERATVADAARALARAPADVTTALAWLDRAGALPRGRAAPLSPGG
jgi:2-polyprenyl-6-methoxyphenol hydroxylase-like FAD-dependent oxidoreductase